jgi:hypothetical protein
MKILKGIASGFAGFFLFTCILFLGLFVTLNSTILHPDFAIKEVERLDITEIARQTIKDQLSPEDSTRYSTAIDDILTQEKPWINEQIKLSINKTYDYFWGVSDQLKFEFELTEVRQNITNNITQVIIANPPQDYLNLSPQEQSRYVADINKQIMDAIPSKYELVVNQELVGSDSMKVIQQVRDGIKSYEIAFWILIGLIIVLLALIALIQRKIRDIARTIGIILIIDGVICGIIYVILRYLVPAYTATTEIPTILHNWLPGLIEDLSAPFGIFSFVVFISGAAILVVSFLFKDSQLKSSNTNPN